MWISHESKRFEKTSFRFLIAPVDVTECSEGLQVDGMKDNSILCQIEILTNFSPVLCFGFQ